MIITAALMLTATALFAGPQFRVAANVLSPVETVPTTAAEWDLAIRPSDEALSGWHWEVLLNRFGFGMHYGLRFYETTGTSPYSMHWKGDFFLSYHPMGGGAPVDPFIEFGWGNAGTAAVHSAHDTEFPDWEDRVRDGSATSLALYTYGAAGLALDLNGLLLGVRLAYLPDELANPVPDPNLGFYDLPEFEVGFFGGIALGSHDSRRHDHRR
jgi:hypothetical protein